MVGGSICTILCMLALAWAKDMVAVIAAMLGAESENDRLETVTIFVAVFWVYALNVAMQPVQSGIRAFIVDKCPVQQQSRASAWASRMTGVGSALAYLAGTTFLPDSAPTFVDTEFKALSILASVCLIITVGISCIFVGEKSPFLRTSKDGRGTLKTALRQLVSRMMNMPSTTWSVCQIQFFAWMGWFPFLVYHTTYVRLLILHVTSITFVLFPSPCFQWLASQKSLRHSPVWKRTLTIQNRYIS